MHHVHTSWQAADAPAAEFHKVAFIMASRQATHRLPPAGSCMPYASEGLVCGGAASCGAGSAAVPPAEAAARQSCRRRALHGLLPLGLLPRMLLLLVHGAMLLAAASCCQTGSAAAAAARCGPKQAAGGCRAAAWEQTDRGCTARCAAMRQGRCSGRRERARHAEARPASHKPIYCGYDQARQLRRGAAAVRAPSRARALGQPGEEPRRLQRAP